MTLRTPTFCLALLASAACNPAPEPLSPDPTPPTLSTPHAVSSAAHAAPTAEPVNDASVSTEASVEAPLPEAAPPSEVALFGADGSVLPQTDAQPTVDSPLFDHHVRLLVAAIVKDDPELARPFFFPMPAYEQVKAIAKPARDWEARLWKNFVRDVHAYHAQLGVDPAAATLERLEVREQGVRWMKPNSEGNRIGYYRVTRSKLHLRKANGDPLPLEVTSMISWRGEWFVVHLHGFR
jgi:hypothetical protein